MLLTKRCLNLVKMLHVEERQYVQICLVYTLQKLDDGCILSISVLPHRKDLGETNVYVYHYLESASIVMNETAVMLYVAGLWNGVLRCFCILKKKKKIPIMHH